MDAEFIKKTAEGLSKAIFVLIVGAFAVGFVLASVIAILTLFVLGVL